MRNILEGLRRGDLEDLALPMISVDEFESRIDDSAIVIAFYVQEKDAAQDLNRFIQRSPVNILDTEISPAPDSRGYFMVFVELLNNDKLGENVQHILEEVAALTQITTWKMKVRGQDELLPFKAETIDRLVTEPDQDPVQESVLEWLAKSDLLDARFEAGSLILETARARHTYDTIAFGSVEHVLTEARIADCGSRLTMGEVAANRSLEVALGTGWSVHRIRDLDVLYRHDVDAALALRR